MTCARPVPTTSLGETLQAARRRLITAAFEPSTREATLLMSHVLKADEAALLAHPERQLSQEDRERFEALLGRRLDGEPIAYLLGEREFYGRSFLVDDRVLIPRPETEHLVEEALSLDLPRRPRILDIGTGSGSIALTLALELPQARVVATDCSLAALALASVNRRRWGLGDRVSFTATDLAAGLELDAFDLVVSNPPYIAPVEASDLSPEIIRFEPRVALFAPPDGTAIGRRLLTELGQLGSSSWLLMEIGAGQRDELVAAAAGSAFAPAGITEDYAGISRVVAFRRR